jgi:osmoprotectant transport system permease protein
MKGKYACMIVVAASALIVAACARVNSVVVIGSKNFTESVILGELLQQLASDSGLVVRHQSALGGTRLVFDALAAGEIDAYVEYSGTLSNEIFASPELDIGGVTSRLADLGIAVAGSLGFENNYALGMPARRADQLGIASISDLAEHPALVVRVSNEFLDRADGWQGLRDHYQLPQLDVRGVDHDIAYRAMDAGDVDLTELYTTDAEIEYYNLRALDDDRDYFPRYEALLLYRSELEQSRPEAVAALRRLGRAISSQQMASMNAAVKIGGQSEAAVAAEFLRAQFAFAGAVPADGLVRRIGERSLEHLFLVGLSLAFATIIAIPLGCLAARKPRLGSVLLAGVGIAQTIPALALLVILVPLLGIGAGPALVALFIYGLLPILRNTHAGLTGIASPLLQSAEALGLPSGARMRLIELPLAMPTILAGIKTAAVINVGGATLGALVGAGGYGQPILTGIRLDDTSLILEGALPAAMLAIAVQWLFKLAEQRLVPRTLRNC